MDQDQHTPSTQPNNKNQKLIAGFLVILAVVIVAVGVAFFNKKDPQMNNTASNTPATTSQETTAPPAPSNTTSNSATYKNGDYSATGDYTSPGGNESITVHVTLKDGTVTDSSVDQVSSSPDGQEYQTEFKNGYKSQVVGKALNSISLSKVSGSSLTSKGFNEALQAIKSQAAS